MRLVKDVKVTRPNGKDVKVDIEVWQRCNCEFSTWIIRFKGRRITPFEQRLRGWTFSINGLFTIVYSDHIPELIAHSNPFLRMMPKDEPNGSPYHTPVILGLGHGVTFGTKE